MLRACGKLTNHYGGDQKREKSDPVLWVIDDESMKRRRRKIETGDTQSEARMRALVPMLLQQRARLVTVREQQ